VSRTSSWYFLTYLRSVKGCEGRQRLPELQQGLWSIQGGRPVSGRITSSPKRQHHCNAGWRVESDAEVAAREQAVVEATADGSWFPRLPDGTRMMIEELPWPDAGTIWTCDECGLDWKATYPFLNVFSPTWVRVPLPWRWPWKRSKEDA
jgi:hypothetical protein